jgi:aldose 1-epimerase
VSGIAAITLARGTARAEILDLGAALRRLEVGGANVVLGYRDLEAYHGPPRYYGVVAGRYANRIGGARFALDGTEYTLAANDGAHSLHGGPLGFDQQVWTLDDREESSATYSLISPDGQNGFPGTVRAQVRYTLEEDGLSIAFAATTDKPTVANLTHHAYFNLAGEGQGTILDHVLQLPASAYTPVVDGIATGELRDVTGTAFDFRTPKPIGRDIAAPDPQLAAAQGYDHNFVLDSGAGTLRRVATLFDPGSGRVLEVHSTKPGVQLYTGNYLEGGAPGTSGAEYPRHAGLCLEPQFFPDSPNQPAFPSARLDPGKTYRHDMAFRFREAASVEEAFPA